MKYEKVDDLTLKVTKPLESTEEVKEYDIKFLKQQELDILKSKNDFIEARDVELSEVRVLIAKCDELDIKEEIEVEEAKELELTK